MTVPLVVLAALTIVAGLVGLRLMQGETPLAAFLAPALGLAPRRGLVPGPHRAAGRHARSRSLGLGLAWLAYGPRPRLSPERGDGGAAVGAPACVWHKLYVDELYDAALRAARSRPLAGFLWQVVDDGFVDGAVNGVGRAAVGLGAAARAAGRPATSAATPCPCCSGVLVASTWCFRAR